MKTISVIISCFKRPHALAQQLEAIEAQTIKPSEILIYMNGSEVSKNFDWNLLNKYCFTFSNINFGLYSRFAHALNSNGEYICIFDDDTIPGKKWLENCLTQSEKEQALYGTIGIIFHDLNYIQYERFGWANPNEQVVQVDIVGHSWFFPREYLGAFWREALVPPFRVFGEDVNMSYSIQKYLSARTLVPPHPKDDLDMWGSNPELAIKYGVDSAAVSINYHAAIFGQGLQFFHKKGFKLIAAS